MDDWVFNKLTATKSPKKKPTPKSGDGNVQSSASHANNPNVPITLCVGHSNQFICSLCDKFVK